MPQNWKTYKLSEVADTNASTIGKDFPFDEILYLDTGSVTEGCYDIPVKLKTSEAPSRAKRIIKNNDLIISTVRPNQKHYGLIKNPEQNLIVSTGFCVITPKKVNPEFLYYCLTTEEMTAYLHTIAEGSTTTYPSIKPSVLEALEIEIPSLPEQKAIAQILSAIDDKIENNLAINKTLEEMATALYKHWFVDFGPFQDDVFVESELGEIPERWEVKRLDEILDIKYGKAHKKLAEGKYPVYGSGGIMRYVDQYLYDEESILIPRKGTLSNLFYLTEPFWSVDTMFYSIIKEKYFGKYTFHFLKTTDLAGMDVGSAIPSLTTELLNRINIIVPEINILRKFDETVNRYFNSIKANIEENQTLTQLRDTLLPKLISGEVRLKEFEKQIENVV